VRHAAAERTDAPPVVDGRLDDPAWTLAPASRAFTMKLPREGGPAAEDTTVRVLYDDAAVYIGVACVQRAAPIVARLTRRDRLVEADWVSVSLDTRRDGRTAFELTVNAAGVLADGLHFNDTDFTSDWDENWDARVARTADGWSAEIVVPLRVLRFAALPVQAWGFEVRRYVSARQELDEWQYVPRAAGGEVSRYGVLDGLRGLHPSEPVELWAAGLARARLRDPAAGQIARGFDATGSLEVDAKWHATPDLTLEATVNPDFAQVEADQLVLNLSTFETWYPEKRPFFREGTETLTTPFGLLYTRRIGRVVPSPALRTALAAGAEQLVDVPDPARIDAATKLVGLVGDGWRVGVLDALVARNDVQVQLPGGARVARPVDPLTAFHVLRARRIFSSRADVGAIVTTTTRAEPTSDYPAVGTGVELCPDGSQRPAGARCFHDAYVGGIDGHWRSVGGDYALSGQVIASVLGAGAPVAFPDGTVVRSGDVGPGLTASAAKQGGEHWVGNVDYVLQGRKLDFDDLGYMGRQNQHYADAGVEYRTLEPWWETLETHTRLDVVERDTTTDLNLARSYQLGTSARFRSFWGASIAGYWRPAHVDDREVGDGTALERAGLVGVDASVSSDPRAALSVHAWGQAQALADGWLWAADVDALWHASARLDLELEPTALFTSGEPRFAEAGPLAGERVFGRLAARNLGATLRATYTFTPRLTLQAYAQLFVAAGHYAGFTDVFAPAGSVVHLGDLRPLGAAPATNPDFEQAALNANVVLRWEFLLGSTLFVVYTRAQVPAVQLGPGEPARLDLASIGRAPAADVLVLKLSYWFG
jgi:hypothetical protein